MQPCYYFDLLLFFLKAVISTIFNQNDSYGFVVSDNDLYLKQIDNVDTKWMPKKTRGKTLVEFRYIELEGRFKLL